MWVVLEDDLVDSCKAGDDVTICGVVMRRWKPVFVDVSIKLHEGVFLLLYEPVANAKIIINIIGLSHRQVM